MEGSRLPVLGSVQQPIRMPAATTGVTVDVSQSGVFLVFDTTGGPIKLPFGSDMMRALKAMHRCQQLLAARKMKK